MSAQTCRCTHAHAMHGYDRKGRSVCWGSSVCGCSQFREPAPRLPEHLRIDDIQDYLRQKGEIA